MNLKFLSLATSGLLALGSTVSVNVAHGSSSQTLVLKTDSSAAETDFKTNTVDYRSNRFLAQDDGEQTNIRVYEKASPAVVSIDTEKANGSGTIITPDGWVLTNAHVVSHGGEVKVTLADGRKMTADVLAYGEDGLDLAVLKIRNVRNLPTISIAKPGSVKVGQRAFAIGNPFGQFQGTFTIGIVSRIDSERNLIQTDAAINPGNSGGPLLNSQGELIGVNTAIFTRGRSGGNIGIGFAISVDQVPPFLQAVKEGRASRVAQSQRPFAFSGQSANKIAIDGPEIRGRLDENTNILPIDNSYYDLYSFQGRAGQQIVIEMKSQELDSYLILLNPDGSELAQDDDSGGGKNAKILVTLPTTGEYLLLANSYEAGESGNYRLTLRSMTGSRNPSSRSSGFILQQRGTLDQTSAVLPSDGSRYNEYNFEGQAGQAVTIRLESNDFDPYLALFSPDGQLVGENDDASQTDKNSLLNVTLPITGDYRVVVNAYDSTGQGQYLLTVR